MNVLQTYLLATLGGLADAGVKGRLFEEYCVQFLRWPRYGLRHAWRKEHIPEEVLTRTRWERADFGDDLLYETNEGHYGIIQCKYRHDLYSGLALDEINTFLLNIHPFRACNPELNRAPPIVMLTNHVRPEGNHLNKYPQVQWILWDELTDLLAEPYVRSVLPQAAPVPPPPPFHLRPDQVEGLTTLFAEPTGRGIYKAACGTGKTAVMTMYLMSYVDQGPAVFYLAAPKLQLIDQTYGVIRRLFEMYRRELDIAIFASGTGVEGFTNHGGLLTTDAESLRPFLDRTTRSRLVLTTYDSLSRLLAGTLHITPHTVLFDEAHRVLTHQHPAIAALPGRKFFFTATPSSRMQEHPEVFGSVVVERSLGWAIHNQILCDYEVVTMFHEETELLNDEIASTAAHEVRAGLHAQLLERALGEGYATRIIVYCPDKDRVHGLYRALRERMPALTLVKVIAETSARDRHQAEAQFRAHSPAILLNCQIYREGSDFPQCDGIFYAGALKDPTAIYQSLCRALRRNDHHPDKRGRIIVPVAATTAYTEGLGSAYDSILNLLAVLAENDPTFFPKEGTELRATKLRTVLFGRPGGAAPVVAEPVPDLRAGVAEFLRQVRLRLFHKGGRLTALKTLVNGARLLCWETHDSATGMVMRPRQHAELLAEWARLNTRTPQNSLSRELTETLVRSGFIDFAPKGSGNFRLLHPWPAELTPENYRPYWEEVQHHLGYFSPDIVLPFPGSHGRIQRLMDLARAP